MAFERRHPEDLAFPRQAARTQGFSLGHPRDVTVSPDGTRVVFLRSKAGDDPVTCVWMFDVETGAERCVFDPREHGAGDGAVLTAAERARRERARERASGVTAYTHDRYLTTLVFVEGGRLLVVDAITGEAQELTTPGVPDDPMPSPDGKRVAYVVEGALYVHAPDGDPVLLAADDDPDIRWGLAEFIAAEEMGRGRGFWWSPDGTRIAACRVDERPVETWWLAEPTVPDARPRPIRYPRAGTANAEVTLHVLDIAASTRIDVRWDTVAFEYVARVSWPAGAPLTLLVQSRDQRTTRVLEVDETTGATSVVAEDQDDVWVELVDGAPARTDDGALVTVADADGSRRVSIDGRPVTPDDLHVDRLIDVAGDTVWFLGTEDDPTQTHVFHVTDAGPPERFTSEHGAHAASVGKDTVVVTSYAGDAPAPRTTVHAMGALVELASSAEIAVVRPAPIYEALGERGLRAALLLPAGREPAATVPVLLSPYGGPHVRMVLRWSGFYRAQQYFADRLGVAVLVIDGRGTPGRGSAWEKAMHRDFTIALDDQIEGLEAAAERWPFLDRSRVAIRGWSFGGELASLAVLKRPDVFHAAVAGAPVTDQRLYDTHYTERYLGDPTVDDEPYRRSSPLSYVDGADPQRPLLLIHGFADDNVVVAHTLQLSAALFARGYGHELVLLPNASHIGGSDDLVVGRYLAELDFLRRAFGLPEPPR